MPLRFGIEAEYLLAEQDTFRPLSHRELAFAELNALLESIDVRDLPPVAGLLPQPPHRRVMPYVIEGYHLPDPQAAESTLVPKGIEIRTPVCRSIEETSAVLGELLGRLQQRLAAAGLVATVLAHHPYDDSFTGPQGARSETAWRWASQAMMTYGPDMNVGLPADLAERLEAADLFAKVDYYAPAMALLSLAAPIQGGSLWTYRGRQGRSLRTFRRSPVGQAVELHPEQPGRIEFKSFDMSPRLDELAAYLALWTAVLLDDGLPGRSDESTRRQELQAAAVHGLDDASLRERAAALIDRGRSSLPRLDLDPALLEPLARRLERGQLPADEIIDRIKAGASIEDLLRERTGIEASPEESSSA